MKASAFWKRVTRDQAGFLEELLDVLKAEGIQFAVIGGQAVNAYAEPVVSLDLDLAIVAEHLEKAEAALRKRFRVEKFPHSINISQSGSNLRVQVQTDPRYSAFARRAVVREVLGLALPVADLPDLLQGKVWACEDSAPRASKRQKDLADIARLLEGHPELRPLVPPAILERLV